MVLLSCESLSQGGRLTPREIRLQEVGNLDSTDVSLDRCDLFAGCCPETDLVTHSECMSPTGKYN